MILNTVRALIAYLKLPDLESPSRAAIQCDGLFKEGSTIRLNLLGKTTPSTITVLSPTQLALSERVAKGSARALFQDRIFEKIDTDFVEIHSWHRLQLIAPSRAPWFHVAHSVQAYMHSKRPQLFAPAGARILPHQEDACQPHADHQKCLIQEKLAQKNIASIVPFFPEKDLYTFLENCGEPTREIKVDWILTIQKMRSALIEAKIFHRDIKLENFLVSDDYSLRMTDMELAEGSGPDAESAGAGALSCKSCGTNAYLYQPHNRWLRVIDPANKDEIALHHLAADSMACLYVVLEILNGQNWHRARLPESIDANVIQGIQENLKTRDYHPDVREFVDELLRYSQYPVNSGEVDAPISKKAKVTSLPVTDPVSKDTRRSKSQNTTL